MAGDDDLLTQAVAATEREIAASVFDTTAIPHDEPADHSLEEMDDDFEGKTEATETEDEAEAKAADEAKTGATDDQARDDKGKFVKAIEEPKKEDAPPAKEARTVPLGTL